MILSHRSCEIYNKVYKSHVIGYYKNHYTEIIIVSPPFGPLPIIMVLNIVCTTRNKVNMYV